MRKDADQVRRILRESTLPGVTANATWTFGSTLAWYAAERECSRAQGDAVRWLGRVVSGTCRLSLDEPLKVGRKMHRVVERLWRLQRRRHGGLQTVAVTVRLRLRQVVEHGRPPERVSVEALQLGALGAAAALLARDLP